MNGGWIKLHREILEKTVWANHNLMRVWTWCLLKASHKAYLQLIGLKKILLQPGQFVFGRDKAALELGMKPRTVYDCVVWLSKNNSIRVESNNKFSVITVVNWGLYQSEEDNPQQQTNNYPTAAQQLPNTNKKVKNDKNQYSPEFEKFWLAYPRKDEITKAYRVWQLRIKEKVDPQLLITAACNYAAVVAGKETTFIKLAATFLGRDRHYEEFTKARQSTVKSNTITKAEADAMDGFEYLKFIENGGEVAG